jgi:DNA repair exonuclease SbcCD nuclease subunit
MSELGARNVALARANHAIDAVAEAFSLVKFVHAADLHLDSPLRGLAQYQDAPVERVRGATRRALERLVQLCIDEHADVLLIAGDLYDDDWQDYATGLFFAKQMLRLRDAGVRVVWIRGNHDAASKITRNLRLPETVIELAHDAPATIELGDLGLAIHGQGFARPSVTDNLVRAYPEPRRDLFNIGLLHTSVDGREGHASYAPCRLAELVDKGYGYWALGHVHAREELHRDPWVVFPGNLQGRHARECGAKGATLVTLRAGRVVAVEHRALDVVRWQRVEVDVSSAATPEAVVDVARAALEQAARAADGRLLAARLILKGASGAHAALVTEHERWTNELRLEAHSVGDGELWLEKIQLATWLAVDQAELCARDDALGQLARAFVELRSSDDALADLIAKLEPVWPNLPADVLGSEGLRLDRPDSVRRLIEDVERMLLPRLAEQQETA